MHKRKGQDAPSDITLIDALPVAEQIVALEAELRATREEVAVQIAIIAKYEREHPLLRPVQDSERN